MNTTILLVFSFIYGSFILFYYLFKEKVDLYENKVYLALIIINLITVALEFSCQLTAQETVPLVSQILVRLFMIFAFVWAALLTLYITLITSDESQYKKRTILFIISYIVLSIPIMMLPMNFHMLGRNSYTDGLCVDYLQVISTVYLILDMIIFFKNHKKVVMKKCVPLFSYFIIISVIFVIRNIYPQLSLIIPCETFITILMYFTIENPDVKMIEQLRIAREEADKANQAKSDFLSSMSHEIRTPLNAIVGFSQALETEDLPQEAKEEVEDIISASESLLEIVNGILDISKIEANKLDIINTEYSFRKVFKELINLTKARMGDSKLEFKYSMDETIPKVLYGDHARVKQVILNLLTNAVKYTKEGYLDFKVSSVVQGDICRLIISVEDSGIGIKKEALGKLFSKFERLGVEKEITIEGTGLGLAITKKLVELMKGEIVVQSVYGKGSRFTIALDQRIVLGKDELFEEHEQELKMIDCTGKNILVVDDNPINLKVAKRLLDDYKANITLLGSGFETIDNIKAGNVYDLILMDDMMPKMNGTETMKKLHEIEGFNMPIIALTANAISGMKEKYINAGFDDYLPKPIQKIELNQAIDKFLGQNK